MALIKCPECGRQVSDQAAACPECGYPIRKVEYKFVTVSKSVRYGGYADKDEYERLLREGWQVVDERLEEVENDDGEVYAVRWHYKLQK
jgi:DNA-directed RNA polymerase subunit RPC12/RpoP